MKTFITVLCLIQLFACVAKKNSTDVVMVDNIELPIDGCVEAQRKVMGKSIEPVLFCQCLIPKLYFEFKNDPEKVKLLKEGKIDQVANNFGEIEGFYEDCLSQSATKDSITKITFSKRMEEQIKQVMKKKLTGTEIEETNDLDKYCDCIIDGMQKEFTATEIMQPGFHSSEKYLKLDQRCTQLTRKK